LNRTNLWWIELGEKKQHNQQKLVPQPSSQSFGNFTLNSIGNSYVFGKQYNLYPLNIGFGRQILIGNKGSTNGIAVSLIYGGGISMALLKPYYLQIGDSIQGLRDITYQDNNATFLDQSAILGASGFTKGLNEIKIIPGFHTRTALRFDYGRYREILSALEVGVSLNGYVEKINIMVLNPKQYLFFNGYIALDFGRRR
jgi:hypothetical protein